MSASLPPLIALRPGIRLSELMEHTAGRSSGFDYLRVALALSVVGWHSLLVSYGTDLQVRVLTGPFRPAAAIILPMFFALSGFLVAGSLWRNTIPTFLGLRALRIVPALAVEVCLSALVLGPLLTSLPLAEYFSDVRFQVYPLNILGDIHYFLPGVFNHNPFPHYVNAQLWTIPFELQCYGILAAMAIVGLCRYPGILLVSVLVFQVVWTVEGFIHGEWVSGSTVPGSVLPLCFLAGVALHAMRERIPANWPLALAALGVTLFGLSVPLGDYIIPLPIAYLTVMLGLLDPPKLALVRWGDYSYGIYLYGFPIEQLVAGWGPGFQHWYIGLACSVPLTVAIAALSWNFVEKPILALRTRVRKLDLISDYVVRQRRRLTSQAWLGRIDARLRGRILSRAARAPLGR